jgi:hypothetical protein
MELRRCAVSLIVLAAIGASASSSAFGVESQVPASQEAVPADAASIDAIIGALYDVISGPAGDRDWDRMRSLFAPGARLIPIRVGEDGGAEARMNSIDDYIEGAGPYFKESGFYETEIARTTESFDRLTHVFSTYESRHSPGEAPFTRGINSIQLMKDGDRWWIVTVFWHSERPGEPIPAKYLP